MKGKKTGGRTKGTPNKDSKDASKVAERLGIDPFEILLRFSMGDWKGLGYKQQTIIKYSKDGTPYEEDIISPDLRSMSAGKAAEYIYPKRKAIEQTITDNTVTQITRTVITKPVER